MCISIRYLIEVKIGGWEPYIGLRIDPDRQGIPICDQHPLANIELAALHYHGVFNVLLGDEKLAILLIAYIGILISNQA